MSYEQEIAELREQIDKLMTTAERLHTIVELLPDDVTVGEKVQLRKDAEVISNIALEINEWMEKVQ